MKNKMFCMFFATMLFSFLCDPVCGSADVKTKQHAICSAFSISADKYVDTGLSLQKITTGSRTISASKLQSAVIGAAGKITEPGKDLDTTKIQEYSRSLVLFVIPGVIILIFSFLGVVPIFIARCCLPQKCCPPKKPVPAPEGDEKLPDNQRKGYTRVEKSAPVISYAILALIVLTFSIVGITSAGTILQGMTDTMCSLEILVGDLNIFMTDLAGVIGNVSDHGIGLLDKVATQVNIASDLEPKINHVVSEMSTLILWLSNQTYNGATNIFDPTSMANAEKSILSAKGDAMKQLADSRTMVLEKLVDPRAFITTILEMVTLATNSTAKMLDQANYLLQERPIEIMEIPLLLRESKYKGLMGVLAQLRGSNLMVGTTFFSFVIVTIPLGIMGIFMLQCKGKCMNCCGLFITRSSCAFLFISMTLVAILGLVLLPISIVFSDVCILMETLPQDVRVYAKPFLAMEMAEKASSSANATQSTDPSALVDLSMETGLKMVDACWDDENLMDALNLTNTLSSFVGKVDFSALDDLSLDTEAMFKDFYDFKTEVATLTPKKFNLEVTTIEALELVCTACTGLDKLPEVSTAAPVYFNGTNTSVADYCDKKCDDRRPFPPIIVNGFTTVPPGEMYAQCRTIQSKSCEVGKKLRDGYNHLLKLIAEANSRFEAQAKLVQGLSEHINNLHRELDKARDEFTPFASSVGGINKYSSCHFVVDFFDRTRSAVCGSPSALSGMLWFAASLALVPLFSIGLIVTTMCINCRIGGIGQDHHDHIKDIKRQTTQGIQRIKTRFNRRNKGTPATEKVEPMRNNFVI